MLTLGVIGTDTGVGKTVISSAILASLWGRGVRAAGFKPIETGVEPGDPNSDAMRLMGEPAPITLREPLAPLAITRLTGQTIDLSVLDRVFETRRAARDVVVVEGAGGLLSPITLEESFASLLVSWSAQGIVVAPNRLGAINMTLLTVQVATDAGIPIRGVVLNSIAPTKPDLAQQTNRDVLSVLLPSIPVVEFPCLAPPLTGEALAAAARRSGLEAMFAEEAAASARGGLAVSENGANDVRSGLLSRVGRTDSTE